MSRPSPSTEITPEWCFVSRRKDRYAEFVIWRDYRLKAEKVVMVRAGGGEAVQKLAYYELDGSSATYYSEAALMAAWEANAARYM
jgi:hypothetical protein